MARKKFKRFDQNQREQETQKMLVTGVDYIKSDYTQYTIRDGENGVRLIPPLEEDDVAGVWGFIVWVHFTRDSGYTICPKSLDKHAHCPIHDAEAKLPKPVTKLDDPMSKPMKRQILLVMDVLKNPEDQGIEVWAAPPSLIESFARKTKNKRTGELVDLLDPDHGKPIYFERSGSGRDTSYPGESVEVDQAALQLSDDLADKIPLYSEVLVFPTEEDLKKVADNIYLAIENGTPFWKSVGNGAGNDRKTERFSRRSEAEPEPQSESSPETDKPQPRTRFTREPVTIENEPQSTAAEKPSDNMLSLQERLKAKLANRK